MFHLVAGKGRDEKGARKRLGFQAKGSRREKYIISWNSVFRCDNCLTIVFYSVHVYHTPFISIHTNTRSIVELHTLRERKREKEIYKLVLDGMFFDSSKFLPSLTDRLACSIHNSTLSLSLPHSNSAQLPRNRNSLIDVVVCKLYRKNSFLSSRIISKNSWIHPRFFLFLSLSLSLHHSPLAR